MTTEERVARMEGEIEQMATKADIERVTGTLTWRMVIVAGLAQAIGRRIASVPAPPVTSLFLRNAQPRQPRHNRHRLQTHRDHLADQPHNVLWIVGAVGVNETALHIA